jgi:hypothetical protein
LLLLLLLSLLLLGLGLSLCLGLCLHLQVSLLLERQLSQILLVLQKGLRRRVARLRKLCVVELLLCLEYLELLLTLLEACGVHREGVQNSGSERALMGRVQLVDVCSCGPSEWHGR